MKLLLDTHILVRASCNALDTKRRKLIEDENNECLFSDISLWEISKLYELKRIVLVDSLFDYLQKLCNHVGYRRIGLEPAILSRATELSKSMHKDPADQIIAATALVMGATLLSDDNQLKKVKSLSLA